jgi:hypothetical protein
MTFSTLQSSPEGRQNFLAKHLDQAPMDETGFIASHHGCRYTPFRPNSMSIGHQAKRFSKD